MSSIPFASLGVISFMTVFDWDPESGIRGRGVPARRSDTS